MEQKNFVAADKVLADLKTPLSPTQTSLVFFTRGVLAFELQKFDEAKKYLDQALVSPGPMEYYVYFFLGKVLQSKRLFKEAQQAYDRTLKLRPPSHLAYEAKFQISEMSIAQKVWNKAFTELGYLERRWRSDENYPEVLWRLMKVEIERGHKWKACAWARKLYSRYPQHVLLDDWSVDLPSAPFEGKKIGCLATPKDQQKRIRRLQWAGQSERVRKELDTLKQRAKGDVAIYTVNMMLASFLVSEGFADEAMKTLLPHYQNYQKNFSYLMTLGRAAARAGEYQTAVGAFHRAHALNVNSRSGREALFQAAFLSYQFQDYDGASRKFEQFIKEYPRSGLSRDAKWHLSWIRYLKGDYKGAMDGYDQILTEKKSRQNRRYWQKFSVEKINYWKAMALLRMNKYTEARKIFASIAKDSQWDYYTLTAKYRLEGLSDLESTPSTSTAVSSSLPRNYMGLMPDGDGLVPLTEEIGGDGVIKSQNLVSQTEGEEPQESESEEKMETTSAEGDLAEEDGGDAMSASEGGVAADEEKPVISTDFRDPELKLRFDRATFLIQVGLSEWAKWELFEIERRTRNQDYLKMLMNAYEQMKSYHRSSYISVVNFSQTRSRYGMGGVRYLWEHAYPRAYRESVEKYSSSFNVPKEFIWGIMRTESSYRSEVVSPVGAKGLMQLMPSTAQQVARLLGDNTFNERLLSEPDMNVRLGTKYLQRLLTKFEGSIPLAAASYNAGPHRVESWLSSFGKLEMDEFIEHIPFIETRNYVKKVVRDFSVYDILYTKNTTTTLSWLVQPIKVQVSKPSQRETWENL